MDNTNKAPSVPIEKFKRTKIIATLGPATDSYETVKAVIQAGANGLRLNFSHGSHEEHGQRIKWVRQASLELGKPVAIIQDLQGPKIRLGDFEGEIKVSAGQKLRLSIDANYETDGIIPVQYDLSQKVRPGERLYIYDGKVRSTIENIEGNIVHIVVDNDGVLLKRKGMNLPDTDFGGDIITEKDLRDLNFGATQDIDYVAQSFVQKADDLRAMRRLMSGHGMETKLIVKFETKAAIENMDEIVREADVVMIARGDLAVEAPSESVPIVQRQLVSLGLKYSKPTIVATQMLLSMTDMPDPTRAEVSDVATAVLISADCVMLSDETTFGKYPVEAVKVMKKVICYTEQHSPLNVIYREQQDISARSSAIANGIISLARDIKARAIVAETNSGSTAVRISSFRPETPIIAVTGNQRVAQQLVIVHGIKSFVRPDDSMVSQKLVEWLKQNNMVVPGDIFVTCSGPKPGVSGNTDTIKVKTVE